ncbi:MAG TPA: hypothetical protein VNJ02_00940 [Vicinamibacterales bacterium]|nr:hypothetical protein [Vicinamibacterales bacterium]
MRSSIIGRLSLTLAAALAAAHVVAAQQAAAPRFSPQDPILRAVDRGVDAGAISRDPLGNYADFVLNTFFSPGEKADGRAALNVNTLDEVPDSSWFTNRSAMSLDEIVRGPARSARLDVREWVIIEGKDSGKQPGFRAIDAADPSRQVYQLEFDPIGNPELATGAEIIGTAIYHALGYNVVDVYLVDLEKASLRIAPDATIKTNGRARPFTQHDLRALLRNVARQPDGRYRALASRFAEGKNLGPFRYSGIRPDDPNDLVPHEHRRELRANRVFCAWLNHDDSRAINTLDMLVGAPGHHSVRHHMFDFGSMLGSGTDGSDLPWVGHEYVMEGQPAVQSLLSLGLYRRPFMSVKAPHSLRAAGNFTADRFEPAAWKPHYPNPAFSNMQPADAFWAARKLAPFTPEVIAAIVAKARYSDRRVSDHMIATLQRRRDQVLRTWLTAINPIAEPRIVDGELHFTNAAIDAGHASATARYELSWFHYDNSRGLRSFGPSEIVAMPRGVVPEAAFTARDYAGVEIRTRHADFPNWQAAVRVYFRREAAGWTTVGIERTARDASAWRLGR